MEQTTHVFDLARRLVGEVHTVKIDAERYRTTIESSKLTGSYIDPAAARLTVGP